MHYVRQFIKPPPNRKATDQEKKDLDFLEKSVTSIEELPEDLQALYSDSSLIEDSDCGCDQESGGCGHRECFFVSYKCLVHWTWTGINGSLINPRSEILVAMEKAQLLLESKIIANCIDWICEHICSVGIENLDKCYKKFYMTLARAFVAIVRYEFVCERGSNDFGKKCPDRLKGDELERILCKYEEERNEAIRLFVKCYRETSLPCKPCIQAKNECKDPYEDFGIAGEDGGFGFW